VGQKIEEEGAISFVDQRITDNIKDFCNQAVALLQQQVQGMVNIVLWTWDLWYLSERLTIAVWLWAIVDSIVSIWIGKPLLNLNSGMSDREADLRSTLQEARVNAKKIAHTQTEWKFFRRALANLKHLASTQGEIVKSTAYVQAFTTYANGVVPAMPLVPLLMADAVVKHGPGAILEAGVGVPLLFSGLSVVVTQFSSIFSFLAQGERLYVLREEQKKHAEDAVPT
jgi:putative ATP-binding cassette transporter